MSSSSSSIYPGAEWKPVGNHGGLMAEHLGLVVHRQQGDNSLYGWFNDPASEVSATWWAGSNGTVEQYVDAGMVAWAQAAGNSSYNSVETEGYVTAALTPAQVAAVAGIYRWGHEVYGWPFVLAEAPGQPGLGWHGMGGVAWGDHPDCPGDLVRAQLATILNLAQGSVISPSPAPPTVSNPTTIKGTDFMNVDFSLTTGADGTGYVTIPIPAGCSKVLSVGIDVRAADGTNPPSHDKDIANKPVGTSGVVGQPAVGNEPPTPGFQDVRIAGAAPGMFLTGHAICG